GPDQFIAACAEPLVRKFLVERIKGRIVEKIIGQFAFLVRDGQRKIDVSRTLSLECSGHIGVWFDVDSVPSLAIEKVSIGKAPWMMRANIHVESLLSALENSLENHVLAFLGVGLGCVDIRDLGANFPKWGTKPQGHQIRKSSHFHQWNISGGS